MQNEACGVHYYQTNTSIQQKKKIDHTPFVLKLTSYSFLYKKKLLTKSFKQRCPQQAFKMLSGASCLLVITTEMPF